MRVPFVDLRPSAALRGELARALRRAAAEADWILGDRLRDFERRFAASCGAAEAIGVGSGTDALILSLRACGIGRGDEVITAAHTFVATVFAILHVGARPVLVDVAPDTYTMRPDLVEAALTRRTRAVVPVHLYGQSADLDPLLALARRPGIRVIADACQAHGGTYKGRRIGSVGDATCFSFYPSKNLGGWGDGGCVVTSDPDVARRLRILRNVGSARKWVHPVVGMTSRLDTVQAVVLAAKLAHLDAWNAARRRHAAQYREALLGAGVGVPVEAPYARHVYHLFVIETEARDDLRAALAERGIETGIHYPIPPHLQPACRGLGYGVGSFPVTERAAARVLSLPMYPELTATHVSAVSEAIQQWATHRGIRLWARRAGDEGRGIPRPGHVPRRAGAGDGVWLRRRWRRLARAAA